MTHSSLLARCRRAVSTIEALAMAWLGLNSAAGVACLVLQQWVGAAWMLFSLVVSGGAIALFAARRSRVAAQRLLLELGEQTRFLTKQNRQHGRVAIEHADAGGGNAQPVAGASGIASANGSAVPGGMDNRLISTYLEIAEDMPDHRWLDGTILRNGSISGRELLAWRASGGRYSQEQIEGWLARYRHRETEKLALAALATLELEWALRLARVMALQDLLADDRLNALTLYRSMYVLHGPGAIRPPHTHARVFQAIAYQLGEFKLAEELLRRVRHAGSELGHMRADLLNPFTASPYKDHEKWLALFNENFVNCGLEPLTLAEASNDTDPFDRLRCVPGTSVETGPLVSIVVSSWKPGPGLLTAVQSLLVQSYRNIEILVIDDCSPEEFSTWLDQVASMDERIRVIRQPVNGGTYMARNTGMDEARGEFMTFLDSDDWNHPRRIEMQVQAMVADNNLVYTTSRALRTTPDLVFCLPGVLAQRENASSMMFRRELVRQRVGYFDNVRKGADTEFALRIRSAFGADAFRIVEQNLSMIRLSTGSLSREEFKAGWRHPSRAAYRRSYEHWHRSHRLRGTPLLTPARMEKRPFQAPLRFLLTQQGDDALARAHFDIVFVGDLRHGQEATRALLEEAQACRADGMRVGLLHVESFRDMERVEMQPFWSPLQAALDEGHFAEVLTTDASTVELLLVRDPSVLQFIDARPLSLEVQQLLVVAGAPPRDGEGRCWYEPSLCHRHAQAITGVRPRWATVSDNLRKELRELLPPAAVNDEVLPPAVGGSSAPRLPRRVSGRPLVLGRITDTSGPGYPAAFDQLMAAYPDEPGFQVRLMGGRAACESALGSTVLPQNWSFHSESELSHEAFLASCDFFVLFDDPSSPPMPSRAVLEAFAAGCVVLLPSRYAALYGDAAVYCEPAQVKATAQKLAADTAALERQRERAVEFVRSHADPGQYLKALRAALARR
ncbi:glycosyltransferase [Dyella sp.]|uniref:glycosyltransferase n=1 Tax=Dyella sp. TaxID=1869338 RepID=UPI002D79F172|nr:glycosyltransferase [Dyella sp.]HET6430815.1 glycosyltransferase [Dyella sp.]